MLYAFANMKNDKAERMNNRTNKKKTNKQNVMYVQRERTKR